MSGDILDTNLLRTPKGPGKLPESPAQTAAETASFKRRKQILKRFAYAAFFLWALAFFTFLKIPDSLVTSLVLNNLNQSTPYQWEADRVGLSVFPLPHLQFEKARLEPKLPGGPSSLLLDEVSIYPNFFSLIPIGGSVLSGSFSVEAYKAVVRGSFRMGKDVAIRVNTDSVDLGKLTPLAGQLDLKGTLTSLAFSLAIPGQRLGSADGDVEIKAKGVQYDPSSLNLPVVLPLLNLGEVDIAGTVTKGVLKIEKFKVGGAGRDLDVQIPSGTVTLADMTPLTRYDLHILIKPSTAIEKAVPGFGSMMASFGTLKPDGYYAIRLTGSLAAPGFPAKD